MMPCKKCGSEFEPTDYQIRSSKFYCKDCRYQMRHEYRQRRKAEGRPIKTNMTKEAVSEYYKKYYAEYKERPGVRERKAEQMRRYVRKPELRARYEARWLFNREIVEGRVKRQPCSICGMPDAEAHHPDYSKPLDVVWLCRKHHREEHAKVRE